MQHSLDKKVKGHYPQVKDVIYHCNVWDNPLFVDRFHFEKINVIPIVANPILHPKSKFTDIIDTNSAIGFSFGKILISGKLKSILEKNKKNGLQFFQCSVFKDGVEYSDYWLLNVFEFNHEYIDFKKSTISYEKQSDDYNVSYKIEKLYLDLSSLSQFMEYVEIAKPKAEMVGIEKLFLNDNVSDDFFMLRYVFGGMHFVSEKLKQEIEDAGCTGIEFQPTELSYNEWTAPGGERERTYGNY